MSIPAVEIPLNKPIDAVSGYEWPEADGVPLEFSSIERRRMVILTFPNGRRWTTESRLTLISQEDNVVSEVVVTPLDNATSFINAVTHLKSTARELGVDKNRHLVNRFDKWVTTPPSWDPFAAVSAACEVMPGIKFFAEVKPSTEDGKWFVSYNCTVRRFFESKSRTHEDPIQVETSDDNE